MWHSVFEWPCGIVWASGNVVECVVEGQCGIVAEGVVEGQCGIVWSRGSVPKCGREAVYQSVVKWPV